MVKIIDLPDQIFFACALLLRQMFVDKGEEVIFSIRSDKNRGDWFFQYKLNELYPAFSYKGDCSHLSLLLTGKDAEFVTWHHQHSYQSSLKECLEIVKLFSDNVTISFYPDGIANYAMPRPLDESIFRTVFEEVNFGTFYNFGIENFTVPENFCSGVLKSTHVPVTSIRNILKPICDRYRHRSDPFWRSVEAALAANKTNDICFLIMRSWCSDGYGDKYNFGNGTETLAKIYENLIKYYENDRNSSIFIVRDDSRTRKNHPNLVQEIHDLISHQNFLVCPADYPKFLSMEFLLASMPDHIQSTCTFDMIVLDSLASFFAPFLMKSGSIYWGAHQDFITSSGATKKQLDSIDFNVRARLRNTERVWETAASLHPNAKYKKSPGRKGIYKITYSDFS